MRGFQLMVGGDGALVVDRRDRRRSDTGAAGAPERHRPPTSGSRCSGRPARAASSALLGLGGDRFTLGFATYMPYLQQIHFPLSPTGDEPTRYQALTIDLRNLALVPALAIRFGNDFRIGLSRRGSCSRPAPQRSPRTPRSTAAGGAALRRPAAENPAAAARYDINSGNGLGDAKFSVTLGGGIYYRHKSRRARRLLPEPPARQRRAGRRGRRRARPR